MKKILSGIVCLVLLASFAVSPLKASAETTVASNNTHQIQLLMQLLTLLQAQLAELQAQSGIDYTIKSELSRARATAEFFYDTNERGYSGVCALTGEYAIGKDLFSTQNRISSMDVQFKNSLANRWNTAQCHDSEEAYVAISPLAGSKVGAPVFWCVDSTGASKSTNSALTAGAMVCPQ